MDISILHVDKGGPLRYREVTITQALSVVERFAHMMRKGPIGENDTDDFLGELWKVMTPDERKVFARSYKTMWEAR